MTWLNRFTLDHKDENENMRNNLDRFFDTVDKMSDIKIDIYEDLLIVMLLSSLSSNYKNFKCAIASRNELPELKVLRVEIVEESDS